MMRKSALFIFLLAVLTLGVSAQADVTVTFQVNTATVDGVTDSTATMQVRGDTEPLTWDRSSVNYAGNHGDYWLIEVDFLDSDIGSEVQYKYAYIDNQTDNEVWEDGDNRTITIPSGDSTLAVEYFSSGDTPPYAVTDSIDVYFRLNTAGIIGYEGETIGVRGNTAPLDWGATTELTREGAESDYWSGTVSFDQPLAGDTVEYKFVKGSGPDWESIDNRTFVLGSDTTLAYKYWNNEPPAASVDTFQVTFEVNTSTLRNFTDSTITAAFVSGSYDGWTHYNDTLTIDGAYARRTIPVVGSSNGVSFDYKFFYHGASSDDESWESIQDRSATVSSDTTLSHWWNNNPAYTATDSIDVFFRVNMSGVSAFDGEVVGVRGSRPPLDWGATTELSQEGETAYYSGRISFSNSLRDSLVEYKFVWGPDPNWENNISNRTFVLNQDTSLAFKYFDDSPPTGGGVVSGQLLFQVDMGAWEEIGMFDRNTDTLRAVGTFQGFDNSDPETVMDRVPGTSQYQLLIDYENFADTEVEYKFFVTYDTTVHSGFEDWYGWEVPSETGGGNRTFVWQGGQQEVSGGYYQTVPPDGVIEEGESVEVTFRMYMDHMQDFEPAFNPDTDSLFLVIQDPIFAETQDITPTEHAIAYSDDDADGIWTATLNVEGPTYYALTYTTEYVTEAGNAQAEGGGFGFGRYRTRYIQPLEGWAWPGSYTTPIDTFTVDPPLIVEEKRTPTTATEGDPDVPAAFSLSQNYPNPFNPSTTFRYTIPKETPVSISIFNILGQEVYSRTIDQVHAGSHTFTWDGINQNGLQVTSGVYFYRVKAGDFMETKKMVLMK